MKYLIIILLVFFSSCIEREHEEKYLIINDNIKYLIVKANDSCEYYTLKMPSGYSSKEYYFHYPQCSWCKKHKN